MVQLLSLSDTKHFKVHLPGGCLHSGIDPQLAISPNQLEIVWEAPPVCGEPGWMMLNPKPPKLPIKMGRNSG